MGKHFAIFVTCALTACVSSQPETPPLEPAGQTLTRLAAPPTTRESAHGQEQLLYVADTLSGEKVAIYKQKGYDQQPIGNLTTGIGEPYGLWVDTHRNIWVANSNSEVNSTILRFAPGATSPDLYLPDDYWNVIWIWVDRHDVVYVSNMGYYGNSVIYKYDAPRVTPKVIMDRHFSFMWGVVGDAKGDLFASGLYENTGIGGVDERPAGSRGWRRTGITLGAPGGLAFDHSGNLVASNSNGAIETFPPGQTSPSNTINCTAQCFSFSFNDKGDRIWIDELDDENGTVEERAYPSGKLLDTLAQPYGSMPFSVAASPDLYP
jgi:hypothetical protein